MRIELNDWERTVSSQRDHLTGLTLAWRAFGKAIGVQVHDPMVAMDGDGDQRELITGRWFHFEEPEGDRYLSLGHYGCWDGGAMRSLSPSCAYISYSVAPDGSFVDFHGWHRPRGEARIISKAPDGRAPFLTKDGLSSMGILIGVMRQMVAYAERANG